MLTYTQKNMAGGFFVGTSIILFEFVSEFMLELMEEFFELGIMMFEWFELGIEEIIKSVFHLSHQQTQLITFYLLIAIAMLLLIYLWIKIPVTYRKIKRNLKAGWLRQKRSTSYFWRSMTLLSKVKCVTISLLGATSVVFLI